jgi:hypothetical protein
MVSELLENSRQQIWRFHARAINNSDGDIRLNIPNKLSGNRRFSGRNRSVKQGDAPLIRQYTAKNF